MKKINYSKENFNNVFFISRKGGVKFGPVCNMIYGEKDARSFNFHQLIYSNDFNGILTYRCNKDCSDQFRNEPLYYLRLTLRNDDLYEGINWNGTHDFSLNFREIVDKNIIDKKINISNTLIFDELDITKLNYLLNKYF